ncbi:PhzF family phenazine biosynthesis protein [Aeromicrobium duanguangcaii]|uniref:PhzF family phenazine biosynthesis protein n=1 Tax=Aeromicrobium duanguangcaii TaxID=2968086 RepID=UPI002016E299|nr:PhzF family phenazine biosynthesis isomerase [Aeromicrobium duanguangcaii]MCL3836684.1 PhzF family phenazine biosynthesis protein [Aeromicrobium duanguangcaii]
MTTEVLHYAAFTTVEGGGNPAGVVLDATGLDDAAMLTIAQDVGYSETAFLSVGATDDGTTRADVRYFSPVAEVAFCGHATLATAVAFAERHGPGRLALSTAAGDVAVSTRSEAGRFVATLSSPPTHTRPVDPDVLTEALAALRWTDADLDPAYPPHVAFAGNDHLVLGVRSRETLTALDYDFTALEELMARVGWTTAHLFWAEDEVTFHVRNPFPPGGVVEDPATGAAAAAFGGYLRDLHLVSTPTRMTIHQGHDMGRPSELLVDVTADDPGVAVTGRAAAIPAWDHPTRPANSAD